MPAFARWPGKFPAGKILNGIVSHQDWLPTILSAAGDSHVTTKLLKGSTFAATYLDHAFLLVPAQAYVAQHLQSLREFPPRQKPAAFNLDRVLDNLQNAVGSGAH